MKRVAAERQRRAAPEAPSRTLSGPRGSCASARVAGFLLAAFMAGCTVKMIDIRPFVAHPEQKLEGEDMLVQWQAGVRTTCRYMQPAELDEVFRKVGEEKTGNPYLQRPPKAPARFTVFRIEIRNESEFDVFVEAPKVLLRDNAGGEYHPVTRQALTDYWLGRVFIELGKPLTWSEQMATIGQKTRKEMLVVEALFEGGRIPSRGEHIGYIAFRDIPQKIKVPANVRLSTWQKIWNWLTMVEKPLGQLQLIVQLVSRSSQYGNPVAISLLEFNHNMVKVPVPPPDEEELKQWRM